jgi:glutathione synthase/RimK-type ligase-like ATP-grasp enzyme
MPQPIADVALLTERRYTATQASADDWYLRNILREDELLSEALASLGWSTVRLDWSRPDIDWSKYRLAVFRTTWDYFDRFDEFTRWFAHVQTQTKLCNAANIVRWNMDKHYLADLERQGIPVVRTRYLERGSTITLRELLEETGWREAVVKPCVSGAARHTYRIDASKVDTVEPIVRGLLENEAFLLQPFQADIVGKGEITLMVFGGEYTHAVRKVAKAGDFRVQDDFGGTVHDYTPSDAEVELAQRAVRACEPLPAYGRVDMVRDNEGRLAIMELELIEPELWMRKHPPSARALARAIVG